MQEEDNEILVDRVVLGEEIKKEDNSIIGKFHVDRTISKEILRTTITKVWRPFSPFTVQGIKFNTFIFSFECRMDIQWIMDF